MPFVREDVARFLAMLAKVGGRDMADVAIDDVRRIYRQTVELSDRPAPEEVQRADFTLPGPAGLLPASLFQTAPLRPADTAILFLHGGGFVAGGIATHRNLLAAIAAGSHLPVVAIDYRLAPEAPWPAAVEDVLAAARALLARPPALLPNLRRLILAGDSAGGTLAAIAARALRREWPIVAQWLLYPATDLLAKGGSLAAFEDGFFLTRRASRRFHQLYAADPKSPLASPLCSDDWDGLPPALVFACGLDPLRDQGRAYAAKLAAHGVPVVFREAAGQIHGSAQLRAAIPSAEKDLAWQLAALQMLVS